MSKVITPEFRVSYPHVFKPQRNDLNGKDEYSVVAIFKADADLGALKAAAEEALAEKFGADKTKWPKNLRHPFRKCKERWKTDSETGKDIVPDGYEEGEAVFMTFRSEQKPAVVDQQVQDIMEPHIFYAGCWAKASVNPYAYDQKGNQGVGFGLNNIQKVRDDDSFGGRSKPEEDFDPIEKAGPNADGGAGAASVFDD